MTVNYLLQVTEDHSVNNAGITSAVDALIRQVASKPIAVKQSLITTSKGTIPLPGGVSELCFPPSNYGRAWRYPPGARQSLAHVVRQSDIVHLHGIWMWVQWAAAQSAYRLNKPFILSTHGMLEPWIWQRQDWAHQVKKYLYWKLVAYPIFQHASLVHAIHSAEAETLKKYFKRADNKPTSPVVVIPNSLNLQEIDRNLQEINSYGLHSDPDHAYEKQLQQAERYVLFLGRLHPVKGIDLLIQAFATLRTENVKLVIAGFSQEREAAFAARLHQLVADSHLGERVEFLGGVYDQRKWDLLHRAWVFCLPSHSEVIGMVNLEAAACHTPVITTHNTGIGAAWAENGGMLIDPNVDSIAQALAQALDWSIQERIDRGNSLRRLIETIYSWDATIGQWSSVYDRLGAE